MKQTTVTKPAQIKHHWHLIDVDGQVLGRISTQIASLLIGKNKPQFTPAVDGGDYVVIINAAKVKVTGTKVKNKIYRHHTGHPGGFRQYPFEKVMQDDPREIILHSVKGMIPKNRLRDRRLARLKIFADATHPYTDKFKS